MRPLPWLIVLPTITSLSQPFEEGFVDVAFLRAEVDADERDRATVGLVGIGIALLANLPDRRFRVLEVGHVEVDDWIGLRPVPFLLDLEPLEQLLSSLEEVFRMRTRSQPGS